MVVLVVVVVAAAVVAVRAARRAQPNKGAPDCMKPLACMTRVGCNRAGALPGHAPVPGRCAAEAAITGGRAVVVVRAACGVAFH